MMRVPVMLVVGLVATAAEAQVYGPPASGRVRSPVVDSRGPQPGTWRELVDIRERIGAGRREGSLTRRAARGPKRETGMIGILADRYGENGTSAAEQRELDARAAVMRDQVAAERARGAGRR